MTECSVGKRDGMDSIQRLTNSIKGEVVLPSHPRYDSVRRVWNHDIDLRPAAVVLCTTEDDVVRTVEFAREHDLTVAVRSGGHSFAGHGVCDRGIVINLSMMRRVRLDVPARLVTLEPGVRGGELDQVTTAFGLAVPLGSCPMVGVMGFVLGGGAGSLTTKYGFGCDNMVCARLITADRAVVKASEDENRDLFWAVRGGGGNFGIVISLELRLHPIDKVLSGHVTYPIAKIKEVLQFLDEYVKDIPDDLYVIATVLPQPGPRMIDIGVVWSGDANEGKRILRPLRTFAIPAHDSIRVRPYVQEQQSGSDSPSEGNWASYRRAGHLPQLEPGALSVIANYAAAGPTETCGISMIYWHGKWCSPHHDNAFGFRRVGYGYWVHSYWQDPSDRAKSYRWVDEFHNALQPYASGAVYVNDLGIESSERVRSAYDVNYERLARIKTEYDPDNFFRINQNIEPTRLCA
jgi:FAD/FMN-containing dehydrogenase